MGEGRQVTSMNELPAHCKALAFWGWIPCSRVPRQCSEHALAPSPASRTLQRGFNKDILLLVIAVVVFPNRASLQMWGYKTTYLNIYILYIYLNLQMEA